MDGAVEARRGEKRRYQRATRSDGLPWNEGLPVRELDGEKLRGENGCEVRDSRDTDSATKRIRRSPSSSSRSEARSSDIAEVCSSRRRLSKLFIVHITFYSRRAAAARRPDGASVVSRDGGCGEKEKKEKNGRTGHELYERIVRLREYETRRAYE